MSMRHGNEKGAPEDALRVTYSVLKEGHAKTVGAEQARLRTRTLGHADD
jgi:hypothetical protein